MKIIKKHFALLLLAHIVGRYLRNKFLNRLPLKRVFVLEIVDKVMKKVKNEIKIMHFCF